MKRSKKANVNPVTTTVVSLVLAILALCALPLQAQAQRKSRVVVFNFQMKSETPEWVWLEKFFADQMTIDFCRSDGIVVHARDEMQAVAQKVQWVPELVLDEQQLKRFKPFRNTTCYDLVTGLYEVKGDSIEITVLMVDIKKRKELFRKTISGRTDDVVRLQKKLSAAVLGRLKNVSPEQILPTLPVWTRSIPALKALYEGVDLYDQGRYGEAWLKFRMASRKDPAYVDAQYWVGKMYYFMSLYDHARLAFDKFMYLDEYHPRFYDALLEYINTYETSDVSPETLMEFFDQLATRFAGRPFTSALKVHDDLWLGYIKFDEYFRRRKALVLERMGLPGEAIRLWSVNQAVDLNLFHFRCLRKLKFTTGKSASRELASWFRGLTTARGTTVVRWNASSSLYDDVFFYGNSPGGIVRRPVPFHGRRVRRWLRWPSYRTRRRSFVWMPPDGYILKSLRVFPVSGVRSGTVTIKMSKDALGDIAVRTVPLAEAREKGVFFENLPPAGLISAVCEVKSDKGMEDPDYLLEGLKCRPEFEKIGPVGSIAVNCANNPLFRAEIDGRLGRTYSGMIGLVPPGEHTLSLKPIDPDSPYTPWSTKVTVQAGKTSYVTGSLSWKTTSPWRTWASTAPPEGRDGGTLWGSNYANNVCILPEPDRIRLVWSSGVDLWCSQSTDGKTFSKPHRLAVPLSTAWVEHDVRCFRHESGRYYLIFKSDRGMLHKRALYTCWSRDFVHWSNPTRMVEVGVRPWRLPYNVSTDDKGRIILAVGGGRSIRIFASRDGLRWDKLSEIRSSWTTASRILQREDGQYEFFTTRRLGWERERRTVKGKLLGRTVWRLSRFMSKDLVTWRKEDVCDLSAGDHASNTLPMTVVREAGRSLIVVSRLLHSPILIRKNGDGSWGKSYLRGGFGNNTVSMAHHPRWGVILSWMDRGNYSRLSRLPMAFTKPSSGPYVVWGKSVDGLSYKKTTFVDPQTITNNQDDWEKMENPKPLPPGQLRVAAFSDEIFGTSPMPIRVDGREHFTSPGASVAALSSRARVTAIETGGVKFHVAVDWSSPDRKYPDLMLFDFSGTGKFKEVQSARRDELTLGPNPERYVCFYQADKLKIPCQGRTVPVFLTGAYSYHWSNDGEQVKVSFRSAAEGLCRFGKKLYKIRILDQNNNFRFNDPSRGRKHVGDLLFFCPEKKNLKDADVTGHYGHPILVDGVLYDLTVSPDGATVSAKPYSGKTGHIRIKHARWAAWFYGGKHMVHLTGGSEPVSIPPDKYTIVDYKEWSAEGARTVSLKEYDWRGKPVRPVKVTADELTDVVIGTPVTPRLTAEREFGAMFFEVCLAGAGGRVRGYGRVKDLGGPTLEITDSRGKRVARVEYKPDEDLRWRIPSGLKGAFTAMLTPGRQSRCGPVANVTFTIE